MNNYGYTNENNYHTSQQYNQNNNNGYQNQQGMNYGNNNSYTMNHGMPANGTANYHNNNGTGYPYPPPPQSNGTSYGTPTYYPPNPNSSAYMQGVPVMPSYGTMPVQGGQYPLSGYNTYMNANSNVYQQMVIQPTSSGKSLRDYQDSDDDVYGDDDHDGLDVSDDGDDFHNSLQEKNTRGKQQRKQGKQGKQGKKKQFKSISSNGNDVSKEKKEVQEFDYDEDLRNMAILRRKKKQLELEKEQALKQGNPENLEPNSIQDVKDNDEEKNKKDEEEKDRNEVLDQTMKNLTEISKASVAQSLASFEDSEHDLTPNNNKKRKLNADFSDEDENERESTSTKSNSVVTIPGTSISLQTKEEIEAWRNERKKNWLIRISNRKEEHCEKLGIDALELNNSTNKKKFQEFKKDKDFIDRINMQIKKDSGFENQLTKPSSLTTTLLKRDQNEENSKLLQFIKELGDAGYLEYELTEQEKSKLFKNNNNVPGNNNYQRKRNYGSQNRNRNQQGR
ncbi:hypothetical protein ACO0QE_003547 [Hanseniaspora vineae]